MGKEVDEKGVQGPVQIGLDRMVFERLPTLTLLLLSLFLPFSWAYGFASFSGMHDR